MVIPLRASERPLENLGNWATGAGEPSEFREHSSPSRAKARAWTTPPAAKPVAVGGCKRTGRQGRHLRSPVVTPIILISGLGTYVYSSDRFHYAPILSDPPRWPLAQDKSIDLSPITCQEEFIG